MRRNAWRTWNANTIQLEMEFNIYAVIFGIE